MTKRLSTLIFAVLLIITLVVPVGGAVTAQSGESGDVSSENCALTAFDLAGQGNAYIQGTSGTSLPPGLNKNHIVEPDAPTLRFVQTIGTHSTAILVIDDFFAYRGEIAHGRLVTDLLIEMIRSNEVYAGAPQQINANANDEPVIWAWEPNGYGKLLVVEVDTENYDTAQLKDRVEDAVNLVRRNYGVDRMVLNMSFVLVPCVTPDYNLKTLRAERVPGETVRKTLLEEVARSQDVQLDVEREPSDLVGAALDSDPRVRPVVSLISDYASRSARDALASGGGVLDPLHEYIQTLTGTGQYWDASGDLVVVAVGSAGNFGRPIDSLVPAAWQEVASASAFIGLRNPWVSSNRGQVMLPGGVYPVGSGYVIGTSFSAPLLSMNFALYMTSEALCSTPPLTLDLTRFPDTPMLRVIDSRCNPAFAPDPNVK